MAGWIARHAVEVLIGGSAFILGASILISLVVGRRERRGRYDETVPIERPK